MTKILIALLAFLYVAPAFGAMFFGDTYMCDLKDAEKCKENIVRAEMRKRSTGAFLDKAMTSKITMDCRAQDIKCKEYKAPTPEKKEIDEGFYGKIGQPKFECDFMTTCPAGDAGKNDCAPVDDPDKSGPYQKMVNRFPKKSKCEPCKEDFTPVYIRQPMEAEGLEVCFPTAGVNAARGGGGGPSGNSGGAPTSPGG